LLLFWNSEFCTSLETNPKIVFTFVATFYIPCIAIIAAPVREFGWKKALSITVFETVFAMIVGGVTSRVLTLTI
jgi:Fe2+ transport system protein B